MMESQIQTTHKRSCNLMLSAADLSGDKIGALLCRSVVKEIPEVEIFGFGGVYMQKEGCEVLEDISSIGFRGVPYNLKLIKSFFSKKKNNTLIDNLLDRKPHVVVLLSGYSFNKKILKRIKERGLSIPVVYWCLPDLWVFPYWSPDCWPFRLFFWKKARNLFKSSSYLIATMRFEKTFYEKLSNKISLDEKEKAKIKYYGHPVYDLLRDEGFSYKRASSEKGLPHKTIALMPGSRSCEVKVILPELIDAALRILEKNEDKFSIDFLVSDAASFLEKEIRNILVFKLRDHFNPKSDKFSLRMEDEYPYRLETIRNADLVIAASGTCSIEALCLKKPMIIVYKLNVLTLSLYFLGILIRTMSLRIPIFALANKIMYESETSIKNKKRKYFPQFIQICLSKRIGKAATKLLNDDDWKDRNNETIQTAIEQQLGQHRTFHEVSSLIIKTARNYAPKEEISECSQEIKYLDTRIDESIRYEKEITNKAKSRKMIMRSRNIHGKQSLPAFDGLLDNALKINLIEQNGHEYIIPEEVSKLLGKNILDEITSKSRELIYLSAAYLNRQNTSWKGLLMELEIQLMELFKPDKLKFDLIADRIIKEKLSLEEKAHILLIVFAIIIIAEATKQGLIQKIDDENSCSFNQLEAT